MELILDVVSSERFMMGDNACHRFLPAGGVIGRASECDWVIPDQTRHLSGRHAIVSFESGQFFITDISTNGIYLNGPDPLPKNVPVPLQDEDRLVMGEHQFRVQVQKDAGMPNYSPAVKSISSPPPLGQDTSGRSDNPMAQVDAFMAERVQHNAVPADQAWHQHSTSMPDQLRPDQEAFVPPRLQPEVVVTPTSSGQLPDNWMELSVVPSLQVKAQADAAPLNGNPIIPKPGKRGGVAAPPSPSEQIPVTAFATQVQKARAEPMRASPAPSSDSWDAFAQGLGLTREDIANNGGDEFLKRTGALLRLCLQGLVSGAQARASLKNEFRLDMTLVSRSGNNPIKFSADGDQVVRHLLSSEAGSFLPLEAAVQECNEDFQHHQLAMMAGMQQAFLELMQQLSPGELERRFERVQNKSISLASKGSRYWEAYRQLHQELQEEDDIFASMFAQPFAQAYDEQIKRLKHSNKKKG